MESKALGESAMGEVLDRKTYKKGETIFREGEQGSSAFVVQEGEVEIIKTLDGEERLLGVVHKGGIFGEMALIDEKPRSATARAGDNSATIILITKAMFDRKMQRTDPFIRGLLKILVDTIRSQHQN